MTAPFILNNPTRVFDEHVNMYIKRKLFDRKTKL